MTKLIVDPPDLDGVRRVQFSCDRLNHNTTRVIDADWESLVGRSIQLDLRSIEFVEPFGLVYLYTFLNHLHDLGVVSISVRTEGNLMWYLGRMDFMNSFADDEWIDFEPDLAELQMERTDRTDRLLEFRTFAVANDDEVWEVAQQMAMIVRAQIPETSELGEQIHLSLVEVVSNIEVHSAVHGGVCVVQTIGDEVYMAFGDLGVGVPDKIRRLEPGMSDCECIEHALEPGITTRRGRGGRGLTDIRDEIRECGTRFVIRSGSGEVYRTNPA